MLFRSLAVQPPNNGQEISPLLRALNFSPCSLDLAPTASIILDLDAEPDQLLKGMKRQTRQNIHRGELAGLKVRDGSEGDLEAFYHLHQSTAKRQGFYPYSLEYYRAMWKVFQPVGGIGLVIAEHDEKPISALLLIPFGDTVIAKILGWSGERAELRPNDAVFWNAILWSKQRGYCHFDFEGIDLQGARAVLESGSLPDKLQHSPDFFKLGYGGHVVLYPPAFDLVPNPLLRWAYKKLSPQVGGESTISHIVDKIRKL